MQSINLKELAEASKTIKLLYVEDDEQIAHHTLKILNNFFQTTYYAKDGQEGLTTFNEYQIDLIITDINMPNIDGLEMLEKIQDIDSKVPAIITTAHGESEYYQRALNLNIHGYLLKPVIMDKLLVFISEIVHIKQEENHKNLKLSNLADANSKLIEIGYKLTNEKNYDTLLETILESAIKLTNSDGGTLYLISNDQKKLDFKIVKNISLGINLGGMKTKIDWPSLSLYNSDGTSNSSNVAVVCTNEDKLINIFDIYKTDTFDFTGAKTFDDANGYKTKSMLVIPLKNREDVTIGVIQLINKKAKNDIISFDIEDEKLITSMGYQSAMVLQNRKLVQDLETLLYSLIKSIDSALDAKCKQTSTHVKNVATIAQCLIQAVNNDQTKFKDINFNENEMEELKLSAWLHDIGKIATPDHIINKSTKLTTVYDRLESIKLKYEILKKDLYIEYLENKISHVAYEYELHKIDKELKLLQDSNYSKVIVNESLEDAIRTIKENRHVKIDGHIQPIINDDEYHNLIIKRGTLSKEERGIINNHVLVTYEMLKDVPFPKKFANVPKIAGSHHKTLDGKGYAAKEIFNQPMSIQDKILAIADVFEALSSTQRTYKEPFKISKIASILIDMSKSQQIDYDLVKLFFTDDSFKEFANRFIDEAQIDEIDLSLFD